MIKYPLMVIRDKASSHGLCVIARSNPEFCSFEPILSIGQFVKVAAGSVGMRNCSGYNAAREWTTKCDSLLTGGPNLRGRSI